MTQPHPSHIDTEASARRLLPALAVIAASAGNGAHVAARDAARHIARLRFALDRVAERRAAITNDAADDDSARLEFAQAVLVTHAQRAAAFAATAANHDHEAESELESIAA